MLTSELTEKQERLQEEVLSLLRSLFRVAYDDDLDEYRTMIRGFFAFLQMLSDLQNRVPTPKDD